MKKKCEFCFYYDMGLCREGGPRVVVLTGHPDIQISNATARRVPKTYWPRVDKSEWCGKFIQEETG